MPAASSARRAAPRRLLITGGHGTLGQALARACARRGLPHLLLGRAECDIATDQTGLLAQLRPWAVLNAAGCVDVDRAEHERARCWRDNCLGPLALARACVRLDIPLTSFSSDLVFDGAQATPYREEDPTRPLNQYGRSKAAAERLLAASTGPTLMIRTSAFFGPDDGANFAARLEAQLARGASVAAVDDVRIAPTYMPDLCDQVLDLVIDGARGLWHLANRGGLSWYEFARELARACGWSSSGIVPQPARAAAWIARRPVNSVLTSSRADLMPSLESALARYAAARGARRQLRS